MIMPTITNFRNNKMPGDTEAIFTIIATDPAYTAAMKASEEELRKQFKGIQVGGSSYPVVMSVNFKKNLTEDDDPAISICAPEIGIINFESYDINDFQKASDLVESTLKSKGATIIDSYFIK